LPRKGILRPNHLRLHGFPMTYLVDANVLCEPTKPQPDVRVIEWLRRNEREVVIDPVILGEIRFGIHLLPVGNRRRHLERWFDEGIRRVHCLPWDASCGLRWARLLADLRASGQAMPIKDSLIAATALVHSLTVVTRNTHDFKNAGVKVANPFA
jgi:toxin FitB